MLVVKLLNDEILSLYLFNKNVIYLKHKKGDFNRSCWHIYQLKLEISQKIML